MILAGSMMLRQANMPIFADLIEDAVFKTYSKTNARTADLGGNYTTSEFTKKIIENIYIKPSFARKFTSSKHGLEC